MKQENRSSIEQLIRSAAPRMQVDDTMSTHLVQSMRSMLVSHHKTRNWWWRRVAAAAAVLVLLAVSGIALYRPEPPASPCYVGRISAEVAEPILAPYEVSNGMSYSIAAGEYEIVIADVVL